MNQVEKLIAEMCPEGIRFELIGTLCDVSRGRVISKDYLRDHDGPYPVYSSQTANNGVFGSIDTYDYDFESITWTTDGAKAGSVFYHSVKKFSITNVCGLLRVLDDNLVSTKFLFYILGKHAQNHVSRGMGNPKLMSNVMSRIKVPIPPLEIQHEIVKVLDTFTELGAELEAELEARRKQYQYYRDALLSFEEPVTNRIEKMIANFCPGGVKFMALKDIAMYSRSRIPSSTLCDSSYVGVDNLLPGMQGKVSSNYTPSAGTSIGYKFGDILIGNIRPYLKKIWLADLPGGTNQDVLVVRIKGEACTSIVPQYLYYTLASTDFFAYNMRHAKGAKMPRGDKKAIMRYRIPLPPLEVQHEIVNVLDKFDALVNDLSIGLPAEINARRKQYEYYRNRLLTFEEAA